MATIKQIREIARGLCRAVGNDCVMDTDPNRPKCTEKNCYMMRTAKASVMTYPIHWRKILRQ